MQFWRIKGYVSDEKWTQENDSRRVSHERARKISSKADAFSQEQYGNCYVFLEEISDNSVTAGVISENAADITDLAKAFFSAAGLEVSGTVAEEVTLNKMYHMLSVSDRNDYIPERYDVLEQFRIEDLGKYDVSVRFGENLFHRLGRNKIYKEAEKYFAADALVPELDRIYAGCAKNNVEGHPVHYMIQTDDNDSRKGMYGLLLQALYGNGRIANRRYTWFDFYPGEEFSRKEYEKLYSSNTGGAVIVRYKADDESGSDCANAGMDTIEVLCDVMKKYCNQVLTVFCLPRECTGAKDIFLENLGSICLVEIKEEFASGGRAEDFLKMLAREKHVRADKKLFGMLDSETSYLAPDLHRLFDVWFNEKLRTGIYPQYRNLSALSSDLAKAAPRGLAFDELNRMIGLDEAKKVICRAVDYYKAQKLFAEKGMKADHPAMHMVFTGNPGTAKTTAARLFAGIMKDNHLLSKGKLIEVGRGDLVGKYVGWTATIVKKKFTEAKGSVLFIDEAYSLVDDRNGSYGDEAINTIVQEMENHRDDVVVIFAGYPDKMEEFLERNPGLRSRIAFHVPFSDYDTEALCGIAKLIAEKKGLTLTEGACSRLAGIFEKARTESDFGNGRYVRNVIEKARMAQAERLLAMDFDSVRKKDITTICAEDIEIPEARTAGVKRQIGFCA